MTWAKIDPTAQFTIWDGQLVQGGTIWDLEILPTQGGTFWDLNLVVQDNWTKQEAAQ